MVNDRFGPGIAGGWFDTHTCANPERNRSDSAEAGLFTL